MKTIVAGIVVLVILFNFISPKRNFSKSKSIAFATEKDSGYITKAAAIKLLSVATYEPDYTPEGRDTLDLNVADVKPTDTIGKFYLTGNGNYLTCLEDLIHPDRYPVLLLIEYTPDGKVLRTEPFSGGMHLCCWDNAYDGFNKHEDGYFSIKTCGTGSGHCSSSLHLFKGFGPQSNGIYSYMWTGWCVGSQIACHLSSHMEIKNDTVTMHYTMEQFKERRNGKYKVINKEKFNVKYVQREESWVALDSTKINTFPL